MQVRWCQPLKLLIFPLLRYCIEIYNSKKSTFARHWRVTLALPCPRLKRLLQLRFLNSKGVFYKNENHILILSLAIRILHVTSCDKWWYLRISNVVNRFLLQQPKVVTKAFEHFMLFLIILKSNIVSNKCQMNNQTPVDYNKFTRNAFDCHYCNLFDMVIQ